MKRFAVIALTCAFSVIMIAGLSSALITQSHSQQAQINEENTPELGKKTPYNRFHRQASLGAFQPINETYSPRTFKKTAFSIQSPIQL